ncbi:MAG: DUF4417 domain-containing protein [Clostridiales bacterium]|nr:DUF4417 domain-containing protein [Clostridiales bacterium]
MNHYIEKLSKSRNEAFQYDLFHLLLTEGADFVGRYHFAQLARTNYVPTTETVIPFNALMSYTGNDAFCHCFVDDYQFCRLYRNFDKYIPFMQRTKAMASSDFSMYRNYSTEHQIWNCRKNRAVAYAMQQIKGFETIPTAGFGGPETWEWCFDGLPTRSSLAITTNGVRNDPEARRLFIGGVNALIFQKKPTALIICGEVDRWIYDKYPGLKIVRIPSFSEQWNERRCA